MLPELTGSGHLWWIRRVTIITRYPFCFREYYFQIPVFILGLSVINSSSTTTICGLEPIIYVFFYENIVFYEDFDSYVRI